MKDDLIRRISEALDSPQGLEGDVALQRMLAKDTAASDLADDMARTDAALRAWPAPTLPDETFEALAMRVEQRLTEELPSAPDPTEPPAFDEPAQETAAVPAGPERPKMPATSSAEFSLSNLARLSVRDAASPGQPARIVDAPKATLPLAQRTDERFSFSDLRVRPPAVRGLDLDPISEPAPAAPVVERSARKSWWLVGGLAAAAVVGLGVVVGIGLSSGGQAPLAVAPEPRVAPGAFDEATPERVALPRTEGAPAEEPEVAPAEPAGADQGATAGELSLAAARPARTDGPRGGSASSAASESPTRTPSPAVGGSQREARVASDGDAPLDALVDRATGQMQSPRPREQQPAAAASPASGGVPESPSREAVIAAMRSVGAAVRACAQGDRHGVATVRVVFGSSGRVRSAEVIGDFAGTPEGSCVARAVRGASVPPFSDATFSVSYPFSL